MEAPRKKLSKPYDPVEKATFRLATSAESGGYLYQICNFLPYVALKVAGTTKLIWEGPNVLKWDPPWIQRKVDEILYDAGAKPENVFMKTLYTFPLGNIHFIDKSTEGLGAMLSLHRNDEIFENSMTMARFFKLVQKVFPDDKFTEEDFMFTCSPEKTDVYRGLLLKMLTGKTFKKFAPKIDETVKETLASWSQSCEGGKNINISELTRLLPSKIIAQLMFGEDTSSKEISNCIDFINGFIIKDIMKKATKDDKVKFNDSINIFRDAVEKILKSENIPLFNQKNDLSTAQKKALIFMIFFAGQETTATMLTWLIRQLALDSKKQEELHNQLKSKSEQDQKKILDEFINREMGNFTPVFSIGRKLKKNVCIDYCLEGETEWRKKILFKGELVAASLWERAKQVADSGEKKLNYNDWFPFGAGKHRCPGEKAAITTLSTTLKNIILNYKVTTIQTHEIKKVGGGTLKLEEDVLISIQPRETIKDGHFFYAN